MIESISESMIDTVSSPRATSSSLSSTTTANDASPTSVVVSNDIQEDDIDNNFLVTKSSKPKAEKVVIGDESVSLQASRCWSESRRPERPPKDRPAFRYDAARMERRACVGS